MKQLMLVALVLTGTTATAQLYFPPNTPGVWDTLSPANLGWCQKKIDSLYTFLDSNNTKAFILLKDGRIVLEKYFNGHAASSNWYWASAGKTITAFMVGIAQQENYLKITDTTAAYLGAGWTSCTPAQEKKITIRHQLTMTSGLDDGVADPYCTTPACLQYLTDVGTRWAYHNAPYTLLDPVIENATGQTLNVYTTQKLKNPTGMDGLFVSLGYNNVFLSTARSMARFGLLILNKGNWNGSQILTDTSYFNQMVNTSQNLNQSYGYLWWLNGKSSYMVPQLQFVFNGSMAPNAPSDMIAALGKNGQFVNVVPSQNLVWIRMGDAPDISLVSYTLNDSIWGYINDLSCNQLGVEPTQSQGTRYSIYPNPAKDFVYLQPRNKFSASEYKLYNLTGQLVGSGQCQGKLDISRLTTGVYYLRLWDGKMTETIKLVKE